MTRKGKCFLYWTVPFVFMAAFALCGCKARREKIRQFEFASETAVNATMFANPLSAVYARSDDEKLRTADSAWDSGEGCPVVTFDGMLIPFAGSQKITVTYGDDCLSWGVSMSGTATGEWKFVFSNFNLLLELQLTMDALSVEGLTTSGRMYALAGIDSHGPHANLDGHIITTHVDGHTREMVIDNMTAVIDFNDVLLDLFFDNDDDLSEETFLNPCDDEMVLNGSSRVTDEDNMTHAVTFENVTKRFGCFFPSSGTLTLVNDYEGYTAVIDFGDDVEECDSKATITIDGDTREVNLEQWIRETDRRTVFPARSLAPGIRP